MNAFNKYILSLKILHIALVSGLLIFLAITTFGKLYTQHFNAIVFQFLVPLVIIACITAGQMLYNAKLFTIQKEMELDVKTQIFRKAFLIKCALLEAPAILSLLALLFTGDKLFSLLAAGMIAYLMAQYPNKQKVIDALALTSTELNQKTKIE